MTGTAFDFELDRFQLDAIDALRAGRSVLVSAPTGSGKTVVAEAAIDLALEAGGRAFYTTPIKALSNQKYRDLSERLGEGRVGLLTGDIAIDGDAPVVVMTTEVLRNMIYSRSAALSALHTVVLDEVHYLQDAYRGPVWEEVIIHLAPTVRLACLSATVSNAAELGQWLTAVRGPTDAIIEHTRPVDLDPLYLVADRNAESELLIPILTDGRPNRDGFRFTNDPRASRNRRGGRPRRRFATPHRLDTIERLDDEFMLPAIYFIFSRRGCDEALTSTRDAGLRLTEPHERERIREIADSRTSALTDAELDLLDYDGWLAALEMGIAAHHAGMIPAFKEAVEVAFTAGLLKVVFATETLALGINMPARTVVIENLSKYNGETHELLTAGEFTQITGRAGRRGIDDIGYAVALWSPFVSFDQVASLAGSRSFPLRSSFRPTYNMAANLVARYDRTEATEVLGRSFAQFQSDRSSAGTQSRLARDRRQVDELRDEGRCDRGDVAEYVELLDRVDRARRPTPADRRAIDKAAAALRPGDVIVAPDDGSAIVISVAHRSKGAIRIRAIDSTERTVTIDQRDLVEPIHSDANFQLPTPFDPDSAEFRRDCAAVLAEAASDAPGDREPKAKGRLAAQVSRHPVAGCPQRDEHVAAFRRAARLEAEMADLSQGLGRRVGSIVRMFESITSLLEARGHIDGWSLTKSGERLAVTYHECDLLVVEALAAGIFDDLTPPELAAMVSMLTYEERRKDAVPPRRLATKRLWLRSKDLLAHAVELRSFERARGVPQTRALDIGFMNTAHQWVAGSDLGSALDDDMTPGDFVRNVKVLVDLLRQITKVGPNPRVRSAAGDAAELAVRGVVATT